MKLVIDLPKEYVGMLGYSNENIEVILNAVRNGKPLTKNEIICEKVKITDSEGEKFDFLLDKARMTFWCTWVSAEFAQKVLGWKMEGEDDRD